MSQYADLCKTMQEAKDKYGLTEGQCIELFLDILGDIEWGVCDVLDIDPDAPDWMDKEREAARKELFG